MEFIGVASLFFGPPRDEKKKIKILKLLSHGKPFSHDYVFALFITEISDVKFFNGVTFFFALLIRSN